MKLNHLVGWLTLTLFAAGLVLLAAGAVLFRQPGAQEQFYSSAADTLHARLLDQERQHDTFRQRYLGLDRTGLGPNGDELAYRHNAGDQMNTYSRLAAVTRDEETQNAGRAHDLSLARMDKLAAMTRLSSLALLLSVLCGIVFTVCYLRPTPRGNKCYPAG